MTINNMRLSFPELCHAATKIQASFRGHMTRKQEAVKKEEESSSVNQKNDGVSEYTFCGVEI